MRSDSTSSRAAHDDSERCRAEARTREDRRAETQEKHEWKMPQYSLLNFFSCSLRFLSFTQDSIANGALVIARLQLATGIRPVGRKAHNAAAAAGSVQTHNDPLVSYRGQAGRTHRHGLQL
jgi:hypothetical protein